MKAKEPLPTRLGDRPKHLSTADVSRALMQPPAEEMPEVPSAATAVATESAPEETSMPQEKEKRMRKSMRMRNQPTIPAGFARIHMRIPDGRDAWLESQVHAVRTHLKQKYPNRLIKVTKEFVVDALLEVGEQAHTGDPEYVTTLLDQYLKAHYGV